MSKAVRSFSFDDVELTETFLVFWGKSQAVSINLISLRGSLDSTAELKSALFIHNVGETSCSREVRELSIVGTLSHVLPWVALQMNAH